MNTGERMKQRRKELKLSADKVAEKLGVDRSTVFRYEKGEIGKVPIEAIVPLSEILKTTPQYLMGWTDVGVPLTVNIPLLGEIAAGEPIFAEENIEEYVQFPADLAPQGEIFFLKVKGDSMESGIPEGSLALIRAQEEVENNEIAAVLVNGNTEAILKRVKFDGDNIYLVSDNDNYEPILVNEEHSARIIGKTVKIITDVK